MNTKKARGETFFSARKMLKFYLGGEHSGQMSEEQTIRENSKKINTRLVIISFHSDKAAKKLFINFHFDLTTRKINS